MKIPAQQFNRMLYNALLFSPAESFAGGVASFTCGETLEVLAADNYVCVWQRTESIEVGDDEWDTICLPRKSMSELEKWTREREETLLVTVGSYKLLIEGLGEDIQCDVVESDHDLWLQYWDVLENFVPGKFDFPFAINPERMGKICRLKTETDYPVDFVGGTLETLTFLSGEEAVGFKVGPDIKGVIKPLNRTALPKEGLFDYSKGE